MLRVWCGSNRGQMSLAGGNPLMEEVGAWGETEWPTGLSENAWHCIEMHIAPPSTSTLLEFWVDGTKNSTSLSANFSGSTAFNQIDFGDVTLGSGTGTATFYLDEFIASSTYNGPLSSDVPTAPPAVYDGTTTGVETSTTTSTTQLSANWSAASDPANGISGYYYAIGTTVGGTNVVGWTSVGNVLTVTKTGLSLTGGTTYYFSVEAENNVGRVGPATSSSGQTVQTAYFQDNFENWTTWGGAWSSVTGSTSTLNTSTTYAEAGTHSLKITVPSGGSLIKNLSPTTTGDVYARFYVYFPAGWGAANNGDTIRLLYLVYGSYSAEIAVELTDAEVPMIAETYGWTGALTGSPLSESQWHCLQMHVAPPSTSTLIELWVDGVHLSKTLTTNFSSASGCSQIQLGDLQGGTSGSVYIDELVVAGSYISP